MQVTIESTNQFTTIDGVTVRLWKGTTSRGVKCKVFVRLIAVRDHEDFHEFEQELREELPPDECFTRL